MSWDEITLPEFHNRWEYFSEDMFVVEEHLDEILEPNLEHDRKLMIFDGKINELMNPVNVFEKLNRVLNSIH